MDRKIGNLRCDNMTSRRWTENETKLSLYLYFQLPFGKLHSKTPEICQLADAIGRTHSSVAMKLCNFASLDPKITGTGRKGLDGATKLDRDIFQRFQNDWTGLVAETEGLWNSVVNGQNDSAVREVAIPYFFEPFEGASVASRVVEQRLGQGFFRRAVMANYEECCCITGIADVRLLNASHIKPWGLDVKNRHNPANGFALSATFDRAFDRGLITIEISGIVRISRKLLERSGETSRYFVPYQGKKIRSPARFYPDRFLLDWHNRKRFIDSPEAIIS